MLVSGLIYSLLHFKYFPLIYHGVGYMRQTDSTHSLLPHFCITKSIKNRLATHIFGSAPCHEIMCLKILVCFKKTDLFRLVYRDVLFLNAALWMTRLKSVLLYSFASDTWIFISFSVSLNHDCLHLYLICLVSLLLLCVSWLFTLTR